MFTQNDNQNPTQGNAQQQADADQNSVTASDQSTDQAQDNYVSNYQPPQTNVAEGSLNSTQNQADDDQGLNQADLTTETISAIEPPTSDQINQNEAANDSSQPANTPTIQDLNQGAPSLDEASLKKTVPDQDGSDESFLPPQPSQQSGDEGVGQLGGQQVDGMGEADDTQADGVISTSEPTVETQSDNDPISDKLDELEALVKEFEQGSGKDGESVAKNQSQDQNSSISEPVHSANHSLSTNQLKKENQVDNQSTGDTNQSIRAPQAANNPASVVNNQPAQSETLADQNIFFLLGAEDSSNEEQEQFLDELQQVVWEDFLESDLDLLITSQEKERADQILQDSSLEEIQKQEQLLQYLDALIPDLEDIMMDKALQLKRELVLERVASLKESLAQDQTRLSQINEAEQMISQDKWYSAGLKLNQAA